MLDPEDTEKNKADKLLAQTDETESTDLLHGKWWLRLRKKNNPWWDTGKEKVETR